MQGMDQSEQADGVANPSSRPIITEAIATAIATAIVKADVDVRLSQAIGLLQEIKAMNQMNDTTTVMTTKKAEDEAPRLVHIYYEYYEQELSRADWATKLG